MRRALLAICLTVALAASAIGWPRHGSPVAAPVLSAQTGQGDGTDHALLSVSTNTGSGTLYYDISATCGLSPTVAAVKAGSVSGHVVNGNQAVSASGAQSANPAGLSGVSAYCAYYTQNAAGGDAAVVATSSFSTGGTLSWSFTSSTAWNTAQGGTFPAVATAVSNTLSACLSPAVNITVPVFLDYINFGSGVGQSFVNALTFSYSSSIQPKLVALPNKNAAQQAIFASPPSSDPTGAGDSYIMYCSQMRAIGGAASCGNDFQTDLNTTKSYDTTTGGSCTFDFCAQNTLLHEFTEGLGRNWSFVNFSKAGLMEFTAYSAPGTRTTNGAATHYPSIDAGNTVLISPFTYNTGGGDPGDWTGSGNDVLTANYTPAYSGTLSVQDIKEMTKQGWGLTHACRIAAGL
jgi:hypothetical protein